jgi:hypothetical protein
MRTFRAFMFWGFGWIAIKYASCGIADVAVIGWWLCGPARRIIRRRSRLSGAGAPVSCALANRLLKRTRIAPRLAN